MIQVTFHGYDVSSVATSAPLRFIQCLDNIQIYFLFIVETVNSGFAIGIVYEPLVLRYGKVPTSPIMSLSVPNVPVRHASSHYILSIRYVRCSQHCLTTKSRNRSALSGSSDDGNWQGNKFVIRAD